jgi:hypothetical protein
MALVVNREPIEGTQVGGGMRTQPYFQRAYHVNQKAVEARIVEHYRKQRRSVNEIGVEFNIDRLEGRIEVSTKACHYYDSFYVDTFGNPVVLHAGRGTYTTAQPYVCAQALVLVADEGLMRQCVQRSIDLNYAGGHGTDSHVTTLETALKAVEVKTVGK